ncbi:hypothetical protein ACLOJK_014504 [Asimina triloba]
MRISTLAVATCGANSLQIIFARIASLHSLHFCFCDCDPNYLVQIPKARHLSVSLSQPPQNRMESSDASSFRTTMPQRIVFLIDLHPLHRLQNPNPYISSILASVKPFISFLPLSSSLFAFKLFFSSLSPLLSTSKVLRLLGKSAAFLSFDSPSQTLTSLSRLLASTSSLSPSDVAADRISPPRAALLAGSLCQISHDYAWEPQLNEPKGTYSSDIFGVRSNLVLLFSPIARSFEHVREFVDKDVSSTDAFCEDFFRVFGPVKEGFVSRDIHLCWVNVSSVNGCEGEVSGDSEFSCFESGIRGLGWGFCSTDVITLGSALVPFGLIYPSIASTMVSKFGSVRCKVGCAELSLGIMDVKGKPLECKCCDLEVLDLNLPRERSADISWILETESSGPGRCVKRKQFWREGDNGIMNIRVKEVWKGDVEVGRIGDSVNDILLLRGSSGECQTNHNINMSNDFFADKVLKMLRMEASEFMEGKPAWQILLNFLYRESYLGFVSLSSSSGGDSVMGVLKPLTIHYAVLYIIDGDEHDLDTCSPNFCKFVNKRNGDSSKDDVDLNRPDLFINSQNLSPRGKEGSIAANIKKRKRQKHSNLLMDFSWSSFCKAVFDSHSGITADISPKINLEDVYFVRESNYSKKLRFLKCWMKQMEKSSFLKTNFDETNTRPDFKEEIEDRTMSSYQGIEPPSLQSSSVKESSHSGQEVSHSGPAKEETSAVHCLETSETFYENISQKIQQSIDYVEADLGFVAERLVNLCIHWSHARLERDSTGNLVSEKLGDKCDEVAASEVERLLLKKPKDLAAKYRTYGIMETAKQKMVKDICMLLENIEFNLQGGMFGGESLIEFAGRTIKSRYSCTLHDIIDKIYTQMEFLSLDDDDQETTGSLPNSEEYRANGEENDIIRDTDYQTAGVSGNKTSMPGEDEYPYLQQGMDGAGDKVEKHRLKEAQERRERARRFASFTSWRPDLQRVWAPRHARAARAKAGSLRNPAIKRKRAGDRNDVVLETPIAGAKLQCMDEVSDSKPANNGIYSSNSVSKALFLNDEDATASTIA